MVRGRAGMLPACRVDVATLFWGDDVPSTFAGMYIAPRTGVRPLSAMERREEDDDGAAG